MRFWTKNKYYLELWLRFAFYTGVTLARLDLNEIFVTTQFFINFFLFFQSGAKINISDGSCPERIVTVSGSTSAIYKAFTLITKKFEEVRFPYIHCNCSLRWFFFFFLSFQWCSQFNDVSTSNGKTQIPIRLIVPASQCGSLIGKFTRRHATKQANN